MLVLARFYYEGLADSRLPACGLYECILGISKAKGAPSSTIGGPAASAEAVRDVLRRACTLRRGRRRDQDGNGDGDEVDDELLQKLQAPQLQNRCWCLHRKTLERLTMLFLYFPFFYRLVLCRP